MVGNLKFVIPISATASIFRPRKNIFTGRQERKTRKDCISEQIPLGIFDCFTFLPKFIFKFLETNEKSFSSRSDSDFCS